MIHVDQATIDELNQQGITWPWPRQIYAPIIDYISEAKAIFIDILFTEPSSYGEEDDIKFSKAIKRSSNVYLPVFLSINKRDLTEEDHIFLKGISVNNSEIPISSEYFSAILPIDELKKEVAGSGNVTISPDNDGVYREIPLFFQIQDYIIPHFLLGHLIEDNIMDFKGDSVYANKVKLDLLEGKVLIRFYKSENPFKVFSASQILQSYLDEEASKKPIVTRDYFKDKYVFIGLTAAGLYDLRPTSVASVSTGVLIHATTLDNLLNSTFLKRVPGIVAITVILLVCIVTTVFVLRTHFLWKNVAFFIALNLILLIASILLFKSRIFFSLLPLLFSASISFIVSLAYSYATEGKQRSLVQRTLLQYMDKQIADYILNNPELMKPGGRNTNVTVFFADIVGFTTLSENKKPEEVANILFDILNAMTEEIIVMNGVIDKYIGDCIMAFWGAPLDSDNDEINACQASLNSLRTLDEINRGFKEKGMTEISVRIGLHTGPVIAGNLGSNRIFNYTVVGDTVNLASRIESVNRVYGTNIIISEDTLNNTGDKFLTREIGLIAVKGKEVPIRIYELIGEREAVDQECVLMVEKYNQGMELYKQKSFEKAIEVFSGILENNNDGPSEFYKKRCDNLRSNVDLSDDWQVIKFTEK